jgi:tetratricopeptide (TPR) repeat protein
MKISSPKFRASHLTPNEEVQVRCQTALELKDKGDYEGAKDALRPRWKRLGEHPDTTGLYPSVAAEFLLCTGILTYWIGSKSQIKEAQEHARDLITQSITFYEHEADTLKVAAARIELAYSYWCEGSLDEARVLFRESLQKLTVEGNTRARAVLGLAVVEWAATQYGTALDLLKENASLFNKISNQATKGSYHTQIGIILRHLAKTEKREEHLQTAIGEFEKADHCYRLVRNNWLRATVKNNVGLILLDLKRYKEAHKYLGEARRLSMLVRDRIQAAQIDESRAQLLIAENKLKEAETVAGAAVSVLERSGQQCILSEVLITHGIILSRLKKLERAQFTFQRAIEVAHQVGALNKAGLAALTMIEELPDLSPEILRSAYDRASEWLAKSQSQDISQRLNSVARKVVMSVGGEVKAEQATEVLLNKPCDLQREVLKYEGGLIKQALSKVNGSVTRAAEMLNLSYQGLAYIIGTRHKDLLKERSPIRRRSRRD